MTKSNAFFGLKAAALDHEMSLILGKTQMIENIYFSIMNKPKGLKQE